MEIKWKEWLSNAAVLRAVALVTLAWFVGFALGEHAAQRQIDKDCSVIGAFRIDGKGYQCSRRMLP